MCGIAGWYRREGRRVASEVIADQCNSLKHRGPDDFGICVDGDFGFGMRRLSILDIDGGHQPMTTADRRYTIVFNGEIFNVRDLRERLGGLGHVFVGHGDTETALAAFAAWGEGAWAQLEGMFAIAIWDRCERSLTVARDPLGIKPLYVTEQCGGLAFASELKALRMLPDHRFDVDDHAVDDFFCFGHVRKPRSIYRQVRTLSPGTALTLSSNGAMREQAFWKPSLRINRTLTTDDWIAQMRSMLLDTTARHMQADVPVGAFLSGGIDSSAVLAAMVRASDRPLTAFTIGYPGARIDETAAAAEIAHHLGCQHVVMPLEVGSLTNALAEVVRCYDEPFADLAAVPTWFASKHAAEHVKVVLCGEGGDELFAGYKRHRNARLIERLRPVMRAINPLTRLVGKLPPTPSGPLNYFTQHARRLSEMATLRDGYQQFFASTQISTAAVRRSVYSNAFWNSRDRENTPAALEAAYFPPGSTDCSALDQFLLADLTVNMPSAMLTRLDRATMAHSLEARVPFLSHKLVDWSLTVPSDLKLHGKTGKYILRKAIEPWLPPSVMRRPKQGFQIPHAQWLRGSLGIAARNMWRDSGAAEAGYFNASAIERLFREHSAGAANHARMLYAITVFGIWWQNSVANPAGAKSTAKCTLTA